MRQPESFHVAIHGAKMYKIGWRKLGIREYDVRVGCFLSLVVRGSSAVECRTRNQVSAGSNPPLLPFRRLDIFVLSIDAPVDSAV